MASEPLEVGDYVRWDKSDPRAKDWAKNYGDRIMKVHRTQEGLAFLQFVDNDEIVGISADPDPWFYHHRFIKEVFLSAASQANRKESDGNTQAAKGK